MGDVIDLASHAADQDLYAQGVKEAVEELVHMAGELGATALGIASRGVWREWYDAIPIGDAVEPDFDDLAHCGDPLVRVVVEVREHLLVAAEELAAGGGK